MPYRCGKHIIDQLSLYGILIKFEIYPKLLLFHAGSDPDHLKIPIFEFLICQKDGIGEMSVESTLLVPLAISIFHNVRFSSVLFQSNEAILLSVVMCQQVRLTC